MIAAGSREHCTICHCMGFRRRAGRSCCPRWAGTRKSETVPASVHERSGRVHVDIHERSGRNEKVPAGIRGRSEKSERAPASIRERSARWG